MIKSFFILSNFCYYYKDFVSIFPFKVHYENIIEHFYLKNTIFKSLHYQKGNGGVIMIDNNKCKSLIEFCLFQNCSVSTFSGGGIYLKVFSSILKGNCAVKCFTFGSDSSLWSNVGMFLVSNVLQLYNFLNDSTIYNCDSKHFYDRWKIATISSSGGKLIIKSTNFSKNYVHRYSACSLTLTNNIFILFCTFYQNNVIYSSTIQINTVLNASVTYCNVVGNNSPSTGIFFSQNDSSFYINNCVFHLNINYLFYASNPSIQMISNCKISHSSEISIGSIILTINSFIYTQTFTLFHLNSFQCNANLHILINNNLKCFSKNMININFIYHFIYNYIFNL